MEEKWKKCYLSKYYEVSDLGRIRSLKTNKILKTNYHKAGYVRITLSINGIRKGYFLARLIYFSFHPRANKEFQVNHINEDKTDNRLCNLNLMPQIDNCNWGTRNKRISESRKKFYEINGYYFKR